MQDATENTLMILELHHGAINCVKKENEYKRGRLYKITGPFFGYASSSYTV